MSSPLAFAQKFMSFQQAPGGGAVVLGGRCDSGKGMAMMSANHGGILSISVLPLLSSDMPLNVLHIDLFTGPSGGLYTIRRPYWRGPTEERSRQPLLMKVASSWLPQSFQTGIPFADCNSLLRRTLRRAARRDRGHGSDGRWWRRRRRRWGRHRPETQGRWPCPRRPTRGLRRSYPVEPAGHRAAAPLPAWALCTGGAGGFGTTEGVGEVDRGTLGGEG